MNINQACSSSQKEPTILDRIQQEIKIVCVEFIATDTRSFRTIQDMGLRILHSRSSLLINTYLYLKMWTLHSYFHIRQWLKRMFYKAKKRSSIFRVFPRLVVMLINYIIKDISSSSPFVRVCSLMLQHRKKPELLITINQVMRNYSINRKSNEGFFFAVLKRSYLLQSWTYIIAMFLIIYLILNSFFDVQRDFLQTLELQEKGHGEKE